MTDNSRSPDWAVAAAFWEASKYHEQSPWWAVYYHIQERALEIAEGEGKRVRRVEVKDG